MRASSTKARVATVLAVWMTAVATLAVGLGSGTASAGGPKPTPHPASPSRPTAGSTEVPQRDRERVLGPGWRTSKDLAWTLSGDATGLHLLTAAASRGYAWRTVATLSEPGFDTDRWIGNGCLTGSGRRVVVVRTAGVRERQYPRSARSLRCGGRPGRRFGPQAG